VLDYVNYSNVTTNRSFGSFPDGQPFDRQEFYYVTPGGTNNGTAAPLVVFINEWMASNTRTLLNTNNGSKYDDWFELYNPATNSVSLAGYYLTDTLTDKFHYQIPAGYAIPAGGFLLVWADNTSGLNNPNDPALHANFNLNKGGEAIGLFAAGGVQIDAITFGAQTSDVSQGRCPDGAGTFAILSAPSPRAANACTVSNTPPVLAPIANKFIHEGQTLTFTASAADVDAPPQTLAYSLDPGAPAAAHIDPGSGVFTWPTAGVPAPSTNLISLRVTDNGAPPLSASEVFTAIVLSPLRFGSATLTGSQLTLSWQTAPGQDYQVAYSDDLTPGSWHVLSGAENLPANGSGSLSVSVSVSGAPHQRFYRVLLLQ